MKRQPIDGGGWFDIESATKYTEDTHWDGNNHISNATGSQWEHEALYCTRKGVYVLNHWSQWQGSSESWTRIDATEAATWLVQNGEEPPDGGLADAAAEQEV